MNIYFQDYTIQEMKFAIKDKDKQITLLKDLCRKRRKKILELEEQLSKAIKPHSIGNKNKADSCVQTEDSLFYSSSISKVCTHERDFFFSGRPETKFFLVNHVIFFLWLSVSPSF